MARALRGDEDHVHVLRGDDGLEMDREAVAEEQRLARGQVGSDVLLVGSRLLGVRQRDHDDFGALDCLGTGEHFEALFPGYFDRLRSLVETDDDVASGLLEVERVGVALGAEAEHSEGFAFEDAQVGVLVGVHFSHKYEIERPIMGIFRAETRSSVRRMAVRGRFLMDSNGFGSFSVDGESSGPGQRSPFRGQRRPSYQRWQACLLVRVAFGRRTAERIRRPISSGV